MVHLHSKLLRDLVTGGHEAILTALQQAVELEHATLPVYLYALYSLDEHKNAAIAEIIQSVVIEEMLHMTLACNVLNALGGRPVIDKPRFIPSYPGPLPGGVEAGLTAGLAPFSLETVHAVFMKIEEPEHPLEFPVRALVDAEEPITIGQFYQAIKERLIELPAGAFPDPPRNQVGPDLLYESIVVTNVDEACHAIDTIVRQGEGTATSPEEVVGGDVAHYYRFAEIYHGHKLVKDPRAELGYSYSGAPVPFDPTGLFAAPANPKAAHYAAGSAARYACDTFNYTYTNLLKVLHNTFNGQPRQLTSAMGLMMSLKQQAKDMLEGISTGGRTVGPSFEYQPLDPAAGA